MPKQDIALKVSYRCLHFALSETEKLQTFNNHCEAVRANAIKLHMGACFPDRCDHLIRNRGVCGKNSVSGTIHWYENLCWAEKDWATFMNYGSCR
jgi:hypothetical protein